jgi:ribonuclease T1
MRRGGWILLLVVLGVVLLVVGRRDAPPVDGPGAATTSHGQSRIDRTTGDLPAEAYDTIELIRRGGPYPYPRDGAVFMNRERRLPQRGTGYWHEYTVVTPGEDDRGARRIVAGRDGELYYTGDHYRSFVRVEKES